MMDHSTGVKVYPEGRGAGETDPERRGAGKTDPEGRGAGKTHPRREVVFGLAAILLLVTCAVVAGGVLACFRATGDAGQKRFTIRASVGGQTLREEVEFDPQSGTAVYRDVSGAGEGWIIQTREGLTVLYWQGDCYLFETSKNGTREQDMDAVEAAMEALADPVPRRLKVSELVFVNKSVPIGAEDDVTLRAELPPMCSDAQLYRVKVEDATGPLKTPQPLEDSSEDPVKTLEDSSEGPRAP
ncbi:Hypp4997 [Branchiostoma lanceolatum]|uniref:Hypp4997 protein n=1 Tax=Branchiostoma lanceolatum TaxID=7740 RepID=A0A8K0ACL0_BRALA|nr:Hypp4997 [Branchiostoma lanceolatum]